jgi:hypothetical protein
MGLYATTTGLSTRMVGLDFNTATTLLATDCIESAEGEIKKILSRRFDITSVYFNTTTSIPPMVREIAKWLSMGYVYEDLSRGGKESYQRADRYISRAMDNLYALADGTQNLFDTSGSLIANKASSQQILSTSDGYADTFGEDNENSWEVDTDKTDDIADDRE